jgi:actin-related protein
VDIEARKSQYENIILSGGSSMYKGIDERLEKEVSILVASTMKVKVIAQKERKYSVWIGGSVLASLSTFKNQWIDKAESKEVGSSIMTKKCI